MLVSILLLCLLVGVIFALVPEMDKRLKNATLIVLCVIIVLVVLTNFNLVPAPLRVW